MPLTSRFFTSRRLLAVAAAALLALSLAACGGDDDDSGTEPGNGAGSPAASATQSREAVAKPQSELGKKLAEAKLPENLAEGTRIGKADAKVTVEMYEDFGCPHCLEFTALVEPMLVKDYVASGKVALVYRYFPLRTLTAAPALASYCAAEQNKFWAYHRELFVAQAEANNKTGPGLGEAFAVDNLEKIATRVGLDAEKYAACTTAQTTIDAVSADLRKANELGLPGTPSFVINGEVTPAPESLDAWKKLLDGLLK